MKIALITIAKPRPGSGDGITEYTYQLYKILKRTLNIDLIYAINAMGRRDIIGLLKTNLFSYNVNKIIHSNYDIVHITNHEIGSLAKKIKQKHPDTIIVTTIHDLFRLNFKNERNLFQKVYSMVVKNNIRDAINYSDFLIFNSTQTENDVNMHFPNLNRSKCRVVSNGVNEFFFKKIPKKSNPKTFVVGYVGSLAAHKNVTAILSIANLLKTQSL